MKTTILLIVLAAVYVGVYGVSFDTNSSGVKWILASVVNVICWVFLSLFFIVGCSVSMAAVVPAIGVLFLTFLSVCAQVLLIADEISMKQKKTLKTTPDSLKTIRGLFFFTHKI